MKPKTIKITVKMMQFILLATFSNWWHYQAGALWIF